MDVDLAITVAAGGLLFFALFSSAAVDSAELETIVDATTVVAAN